MSGFWNDREKTGAVQVLGGIASMLASGGHEGVMLFGAAVAFEAMVEEPAIELKDLIVRSKVPTERFIRRVIKWGRSK